MIKTSIELSKLGIKKFHFLVKKYKKYIKN